MNQYQKELFRGSGFNSLLSSPQNLNDQPLVLPKVDIFSGIDHAYKTAILAQISRSACFEKFLQLVGLAFIPIIGFAGSGKTEMLALSSLAFIANPDIGRIYCSAPTHVATSNFAQRLHRLGGQIAAKLDSRSPGKFKIPFVVRGYELRSEAAAFIQMIEGKHPNVKDPYYVTEWPLPLSPCEWLLKVVHFAQFHLEEMDCPRLHSLRERFDAKPQYKGLRLFVAGDISFHEVARYLPSGKDEDTPMGVVRDLITEVIASADAVCTTPYTSDGKVYELFKTTIARGVVLDEAGAMHQADAMQVWGPGCRPCVLAGDERQLPPAVMTDGQRDIEGNFMNMFSLHARISILEHVKRSGWPCFVLNTQYRIVPGGFDVARQTIYPDVVGFQYAPSVSLQNHPQASKIEAWALNRYNPGMKYASPRSSPTGKVLPWFISCDAPCKQPEGVRSRYNLGQNSIAIELVEDLLQANLGLRPASDDIVIITPYRENVRLLREELEKHPLATCRTVSVNTADSFQGREGQVVVFVMCVSAGTGALFVAQPHRLCVGLTRHQMALFIVGDIHTKRDGPHQGNGRFWQGEWDDRFEKNTFEDILGYFRTTGRVVDLKDRRTPDSDTSSTRSSSPLILFPVDSPPTVAPHVVTTPAPVIVTPPVVVAPATSATFGAASHDPFHRIWMEVWKGRHLSR